MSNELQAKNISYDVTDVLYFKKGQKLSFFYVASGTENPFIVEFKAFVTAFDDAYQSKWTPNSVYGRMDPIATFESTIRKISVSFDVPAYDNQEAKQNLEKMTSLIQMLYPVYDSHADTTESSTQIIGAPLIRMKFGNLICRSPGGAALDVMTGGLLGYLDGINFTPDIDAGFHDPSNKLYPMGFKLNCSFNVLHEHNMGFKISDGNLIPRTFAFPYDEAASAGPETETISKPTIHSEAKSTEKCDEANYNSALGITSDKKCGNSAVVTPEGSFRDSVVGKIFDIADAVGNF